MKTKPIPTLTLALTLTLSTLGAWGLLTPAAHAEPIDPPLLYITSDEPEAPPFVYWFRVRTEGGEIRKLLYHTFPGSDSSRPYDLPITLLDLRKGINLVERMGFTIVKISGTQLDPRSGGKVTITFLNGFTMGVPKRSEWAMDVVFEGGRWIARKDGRPIEHIELKTAKRGIKAIVVCDHGSADCARIDRADAVETD